MPTVLWDAHAVLQRFQAFRDWSRDNHMFEKIKISEAAGQKYSGRARALWDLDETDHTYLLESVPFTHASEKLTKDNIQYNKLFTKLVKQSWNKALAEARRRMAARVRCGVLAAVAMRRHSTHACADACCPHAGSHWYEGHGRR